MSSRILKRYGVIEIGTRGLRLLIADASPSGIDRVVYSTGDLSELGRDQTAEGSISPQSVSRTKAIVNRYLGLANQYKASQVVAFATEIARSAKNRAKFLQEMKSIIEVRVLKEEEEALYSFVASADAFRVQLTPDDVIMVVDQGGGSTELSCGLVRADGTKVLRGYESLPLGTVELGRVLANAKTLERGYYQVSEAIRAVIDRHVKFAALSSKSPSTVIGLGSGITMAVKFTTRGEAGGKSLQDLHGKFIATKKIDEMIENFSLRLGRSKEADLGVTIEADNELGTLLVGILTYQNILQKYHARGVTVSRHGLRYGFLSFLAGQPCIVDIASIRANQISEKRGV